MRCRFGAAVLGGGEGKCLNTPSSTRLLVYGPASGEAWAGNLTPLRRPMFLWRALTWTRQLFSRESIVKSFSSISRYRRKQSAWMMDMLIAVVLSVCGFLCKCFSISKTQKSVQIRVPMWGWGCVDCLINLRWIQCNSRRLMCWPCFSCLLFFSFSFFLSACLDIRIHNWLKLTSGGGASLHTRVEGPYLISKGEYRGSCDHCASLCRAFRRSGIV